jgi:hypothetical protein
MEIAEKNCRFRARDDEDKKNEEQKAEHVIHLIRPQRVENEEQLNENTA